MADLSEATSLIPDGDSRLDGADIIPMIVPGVAGDDKGYGMTFDEFAARIAGYIMNRNGAVRTTDLTLSATSASVISVTITPSSAAAKIRVSAAVWHSGITGSEVLRARFFRGTTNISSKSSRSPAAVGTEPLEYWTVDEPNTRSEVSITYSVGLSRETL